MGNKGPTLKITYIFILDFVSMLLWLIKVIH